MRARVALALALACAPLVAHAQGEPPADAGVAPPPDAPPAPPPPPAEQKPAPPTPEELAQRIQDLEDKQAQLERQQATNEGTREQVKQLMPLASFIKVFVDVGAFAVAGNGSGIRSDLGNLYYPKYRGIVPGEWVFMGDPLATAINSLGEPTDTLHSGGHPSFIVNSVGLAIGKYIDHGISISALAELLPRPNQNILDIELANIQWRPYEDLDLVIIAGKIDSVLGIEYRSQDAPRRLEVTPSLICRYTCGRPLGIESRLVRGPLSVSASLTNGDSFMNRFEPETVLHANDWPTAAGHVQWLLPVGSGLELGVSGAFGPQDKQPSTDIYQWHVGFDAWLHDLAGFEATAEYVKGLQQGRTTSTTPCDAAPCLTYQGAYLRVDRRVNNWLIPYVRFDWRDAVHQNGAIFVYESHVTRVTVGAHVEWTPRIIGKIEYTFIRELDPIPDFPDDVITTSIVVATD
jgi:hypothetical protein